MDSRKETRYERRKRKRGLWRVRLKDNDDYTKVFSFKNLYRSYRKCRRHVSWKCSVQKFIVNAPLIVYRLYKLLINNRYKSTGFYEFDIHERGKSRHIRSVTIKERVVQRCLCDNALVPVLQRFFIHDNGACMRGKGYTFQNRRLARHLLRHVRKYGRKGYILIYDFSKFFDNIPHGLAKGILNRAFCDKRIVSLTSHFIDAFGETGLGLGSQISQILALASANRLDHVVKEELGMKAYGRYNDDGYIISESKEKLQKCLERIKGICGELGFRLNEKKTQIINLKRGFTWLKVNHTITESGRHIRRINKKSIVRQRRKFKKFRKRMDRGLMLLSDITAAKASWFSYASNFNSYHTRMNMETYYHNIIGA